MDDPSPGAEGSRNRPEARLDSWKEIAAHLNRDVTTVQRWEKREGMPVHRHLHDKRGSVYAVGSELDAWLSLRRAALEDEATVDKEPSILSNIPKDANPPQRNRQPARRWLALGGLAVIAALAIAYGISPHRRAGAANQKIKSLAVLPLKNLSADPSQEYLADGMTEALIGRLSGIHDLRVISHTSVMRFKNPQMSVPEIAKLLHVDAIVEGSVIRQGSRVRITAQLIRGATDDHFWSQTYDRELRDALALQSDVAQSIAEKVEATVTGEEHERLTAAAPVAPEIYESYLKGRFTLHNSNNRAGLQESIRYFQDAINRDPTFAPPYLGLAEATSELGTGFIGVPPDETRPKVLSAVHKALQLDPNLVNAHILLANLEQEQWHWADAEAEYKRALELNPNDAYAHFGFAFWLLCQGRADEALTWAERGRELDPLSASSSDIGWILFNGRRYDEAERELRSVLAVQPNDASALWDLGFVLIANKKPADAIPVLEKAVSLSNRSPGPIGVLIAAYAHSGRRSDALRLLAELKNREKSGYVPTAAFVNAYLGLGENEQAFVWLDHAREEQSNILQFLKVHPFMDPIRNDPRFAELVHRVGLDASL